MRHRLTALLLVFCSLCAGVALVAGFGWYRATHAAVALERLSPEERQKLASEMVSVSGEALEHAWFEPALGFTLRPNAEITTWEDTFRSNEIGMRSGAVAKEPGAFRVLFVGDSWTYGMGIRASESFAKAFERLAAEYAGSPRPIEAWTLALPGWNTLSELAALWFFFDRLEPDAVVLCPTSNDHHSLNHVAPNGWPVSVGVVGDEFGDEHCLTYGVRHLDSFRARERWRAAFAAIRETETRLQARGVPLWLFFVARWEPAFAHALTHDAGIEAPYFIAPMEYTLGRWLCPPPIQHGSAEANTLYGAMVYDSVAAVLGWPVLPESVEYPRVRLFRAPPPESEWRAEAERLLVDETRKEVPESYRAGPGTKKQCAGPLDPETGLLGRASTVLVRRPPGARQLLITVRKLAEAPALYPLDLTVAIPSPGGGTRWVQTIPAGAAERVSFSVDLPPDVSAGSALDVVFVASRTAQAPDVLAARSLFIESIVPGP